jgi:hypothetical protein
MKKDFSYAIGIDCSAGIVLCHWLPNSPRETNKKNASKTSIDSYVLSESDHTFADMIASRIASKTDTTKQTLVALVRTIEQGPQTYI